MILSYSKKVDEYRLPNGEWDGDVLEPVEVEIGSKELADAISQIIYEDYFSNKETKTAIKDFVFDIGSDILAEVFEEQIKEFFKESDYV